MQSPVTNEDAIVAVAAVEDTVPGGDSQPAVAVDSSDLGTVSPAPVPFVPTLGAWAKPLKLSPSALSVQRKFGSNLLQDLSYPTSHWPSLPSGQREGHTKNMATPVPNKGPMVTVAGGDSQPVVAVDSPDLRSTVFSPVSPASVPLVPTLGAWAKPLKIHLPSSSSGLAVPWDAGSNQFQDPSDTSQLPSFSSGQRGHTKNISMEVINNYALTFH